MQPGEGENGRIEDIMSHSHQCFLIAALGRIRRQFKTLRRRQPSRRGGFARHNGGDGERRFPSAVGADSAARRLASSPPTKRKPRRTSIEFLCFIKL